MIPSGRWGEEKATAIATPTERNPAQITCGTVDESRTYNGEIYICTEGSGAQLVWLSETDSRKVVEAREAKAKAAAAKVAVDKAAAQRAAAKATADKLGAEEAAVQEAAARKAAADQAAAAQAAPDRAAQQAAVPAAPVYAGAPGYAPHLDRHGDGIGCE